MHLHIFIRRYNADNNKFNVGIKHKSYTHGGHEQNNTDSHYPGLSHCALTLGRTTLQRRRKYLCAVCVRWTHYENAFCPTEQFSDQSARPETHGEKDERV